nr:hypothetical protein [Glaciimonas sp. PAMC28666]
MQRTPAGLPCGMPGIAEEMDGAVQQAPQPGRHEGGNKEVLTIESGTESKGLTIGILISMRVGVKK